MLFFLILFKETTEILRGEGITKQQVREMGRAETYRMGKMALPLQYYLLENLLNPHPQNGWTIQCTSGNLIHKTYTQHVNTDSCATNRHTLETHTRPIRIVFLGIWIVELKEVIGRRERSNCRKAGSFEVGRPEEWPWFLYLSSNFTFSSLRRPVHWIRRGGLVTELPS